MVSPEKLKDLCKQRKMSVTELASHLVRGSRDQKEAARAVRNWQKGLFKPKPSADDVRSLASALNVEANEIMDWPCSYRYAPFSARKARLVTQLIVGRSVQDAMDILKFTRKRAAPAINKLLKCAVADADEQQADVESLANFHICFALSQLFQDF